MQLYPCSSTIIQPQSSIYLIFHPQFLKKNLKKKSKGSNGCHIIKDIIKVNSLEKALLSCFVIVVGIFMVVGFVICEGKFVVI